MADPLIVGEKLRSLCIVTESGGCRPHVGPLPPDLQYWCYEGDAAWRTKADAMRLRMAFGSPKVAKPPKAKKRDRNEES